MRTTSLHLCLAALLLTSCTPASEPGPLDNQSEPSARPTSFNPITPTSVLVSPATNLPATVAPIQHGPVFTEPDPETYVMVLPAVLEYFYFRKKAMISGDPEVLWAQYPEFKTETDIPKGINAEGFIISNYRGLKLFDGNVSPQYYERIKVRTGADEIEVLVHGMELYLFLDDNGLFNESGGEFKIVLHLQMKDDRWVVVKTDEVVQSEWEQFSP